jgi:hypothetical protein
MNQRKNLSRTVVSIFQAGLLSLILGPDGSFLAAAIRGGKFDEFLK